MWVCFGPGTVLFGVGYVLICNAMSVVGSLPGQFDDAEEDR